MHIAKTAGSYINQLLVDALGENRCLLHIEHTLNARFPGSDPVKTAFDDNGLQYLSGHVYYKNWKHLRRNLKSSIITVSAVREPFSHMASHIQWLDHYNLSDSKTAYSRLSAEIRALVDQIGQLDFENTGQLDHFLTHLSGVGVQLLDNCQSRYFTCGHGSAVNLHEALTLNHTSIIGSSMQGFDLLLKQDCLNKGVEDFAEITGIPVKVTEARVNPAKSERVLDITSPVIRSVLSKRCLVDQWLWRQLDK